MTEDEIKVIERYIAEIEKRVAQQLALINRFIVFGFDTVEAYSLLHIMRLNLSLAHEHRHAILRMRDAPS